MIESGSALFSEAANAKPATGERQRPAPEALNRRPVARLVAGEGW
jgi:hypothetical protein